MAALFVLFWVLFQRFFRQRPAWVPPVFLSGVMGLFTVVNLVNGGPHERWSFWPRRLRIRELADATSVERRGA